MDDTQHFLDAIAVGFLRQNTTMVSASVGKERLQILSGNASVWKTVHEPVKNEDQVNKIDTTWRKLLLRTYLTLYPDCAKSDPKANQDQATKLGNAWLLSIQNSNSTDSTLLQNYKTWLEYIKLLIKGKVAFV